MDKTMKELKCDMHATCKEPIARIDNKGFIYCNKHGLQRKLAGIPCRLLKPFEIKSLEVSKPLARY